MTRALRRLPTLLAGARLLLAPALWPLALAGRQRALAVGLLVALATDVLDGQAARWLGQGGEALSRLDSLADKALTLSVLAWLLLLHPAILREQAALALVALALAAASWAAGLLRHGRVTGLHLRLAKLGGAAQAAFVLHTFWTGAYSPWLFRLAAWLWCLAAAEEILVQLTRREVGGATRGLLEAGSIAWRPWSRARRQTTDDGRQRGPQTAAGLDEGRRTKDEGQTGRYLGLWSFVLGLARQELPASTTRVAAAMRDPRLPFGLAALAVALTLPALWTGWSYDDHTHRALLAARPGVEGLAPATMDMFRFLTGDPGTTIAAVERGALAWWTLPEARQAFWRPLSGLTHWLDYQLWPGSPALMHLHSLAWLAALVVAVAALYRRLMGPVAAAGLAATLYALDDARGFAAAWVANRNALLAALLGALALLAHVRWRSGANHAGRRAYTHARGVPAAHGPLEASTRIGERGGSRGAIFALLSAIALGGGLLAGEAAVATLGYLAAYALWLERGPWRARLLSLAPAVAVVLVWRAAYSAMGYGAYGTAYLDPAAEPLRFAWAVLARSPLLLVGQWTPLPAELSPFLPPPAAELLWLAAMAIAAGLAWLFAPLLRADRQARFWATGMLLALPPACAALPANRLLFFVGLGAMGLLARMAAPEGAGGHGEGGYARPPQGGMRRVLLGALLVTHLVLGPLALPLTAYSPALVGGAEAALATLPSGPGVEGQTFVVVLGPSALVLAPLRAVRGAAGVPAPAGALLLAASLGGAWVERPDARTLVVRPDGGYLLGFESVFRAPWHPLAVGEAVGLASCASRKPVPGSGRRTKDERRTPRAILPSSFVIGRWSTTPCEPPQRGSSLTATVTELTPDGRPAAAAFRFDAPLEGPEYALFVWRDGAYVPFTPPPVGGAARVAPALGSDQ